MSQYDAVLKELHTTLFFLSANCGHAYRMIEEVKFEEDLDSISGKIQGISKELQQVNATITRWRVNDDSIEAQIEILLMNLENLKRLLTGLKVRFVSKSVNLFLNEWLPVLNEAVKLTNNILSAIANYKKIR